MPTLEDAIQLALSTHRGQHDKAGRPYILHPLRVMLALDADDERIVGVLHDVVEDSAESPSPVTLDTLRRFGYSERVVVGVGGVTRRVGESYEAFVARAKGNALARRVKLADLADNLDVQRLNEIGPKDVERLNRYLRAVRELME
jgi:(p)ppGpp synthase/HD superfamily hydrolase